MCKYFIIKVTIFLPLFNAKMLLFSFFFYYKSQTYKLQNFIALYNKGLRVGADTYLVKVVDRAVKQLQTIKHEDNAAH